MVWFALILLVVIVVDVSLRITAAPAVMGILEAAPPFVIIPEEPDANAERIAFPTSHGLELRGSLRLTEDPCGLVIFCPELGGNHWMATRYCGALSDAGYALLAFDFRNQGDSDALPGYEPLHWITDHEVRDVHAAIQFARETPALAGLPIGLAGISRGGSAALAAAASDRNVAAVMADSAFSLDSMIRMFLDQWARIYLPGWILRSLPRWHLLSMVKTAIHISQWRRSCRYVRLERLLPNLADRGVLLISGQRDSYVKPKVAEELAEAIGATAEVWLVPGAKHNKACEVAPEEYDRRIVSFFECHLSDESPRARGTTREVPVAE